MTDGLTFAEPHWLHLMWPLLATTVVMLWLRIRKHRSTERLVAQRLLAQLVDAPSQTRVVARIALVTLSGIAICVALMRPQWGFEVVEQSRAGAAIMICLDVSRSMLARDVVPNRLERAKAEIRDLLGMLEGDQVGLIAFAGRASVMSPLTPDFSFLRLALDDAVPTSISIGGTRIAEPIQKAVDGFSRTNDVSRSIILITDGEDHDEFAKEAAQYAAKRGVRILAIGFGDENGARIEIIDPNTGAATKLVEANGEPVLSKLNAPLLRELALITDGAYIPAGTGSLDLRAIYSQHIEPLTRAQLSSGQRIVRQEMYQWAILVALAALIGALLSTRHRPRLLGWVAPLLFAPALFHADHGAHAQTQATSGASVNATAKPTLQTASAAPEQESPSDTAPELAIPPHARDAYNAGERALRADELDDAEALFQGAIANAGTDEPVHFRATFNLAWVAVKRADKQLKAEPKMALSALQLAAERWRQALALRPADPATEANLASVTQRALILSDKLASTQAKNFVQLLDQAIASQRQALNKVRALLTVEPSANTPIRPETVELIGVADKLALTIERGAADLEAAKSQATSAAPGPQTPPQQLPPTPDANTLERSLHHLELAQQRNTQARAQLRRREFQRAFRRASLTLDSLRRAREQTLELNIRLRALRDEQTALTTLTAQAQTLRSQFGEQQRPSWISDPYLAQSQTGLAQRTSDLSALAEAKPAEQALTTANAALRDAATALSSGDALGAMTAQSTGINALQQALEMFMPLRELIELTHTREQQIANSTKALNDATRKETWPALRAGQDDNIERMVRLGKALSEASVKALEEERSPAPNAASGSAKTPAAPSTDSAAQAAAAQRQRLEQAYAIWTKARDHMYAAADAFAKPAHTNATDEATTTLEQTLKQLHELRKLFFNILEHLEELARRQAGLNDDALKARDSGATGAQPKSLAARQTGHRQTAEQLQQALVTQASEAAQSAASGHAAQSANPQPGRSPSPGPASPPAQGQPDPQALQQAAALVDNSAKQMHDASEHLNAVALAWPDVESTQTQALQFLLDAIKRLRRNQQQPPEQQNPDQQNQEQPQDQDQQGAQQQPGQAADDASDGQSGLLQGVRDREAARREDQRQQRQRYAPVDKDW